MGENLRQKSFDFTNSNFLWAKLLSLVLGFSQIPSSLSLYKRRSLHHLLCVIIFFCICQRVLTIVYNCLYRNALYVWRRSLSFISSLIFKNRSHRSSLKRAIVAQSLTRARARNPPHTQTLFFDHFFPACQTVFLRRTFLPGKLLFNLLRQR